MIDGSCHSRQEPSARDARAVTSCCDRVLRGSYCTAAAVDRQPDAGLRRCSRPPGHARTDRAPTSEVARAALWGETVRAGVPNVGTTPVSGGGRTSTQRPRWQARAVRARRELGRALAAARQAGRDRRPGSGYRAAVLFGIIVHDVHAVHLEAKTLRVWHGTTLGHHLRELTGGRVQMDLRDPAGNLAEVDWPDVTTLDRSIVTDLKTHRCSSGRLAATSTNRQRPCARQFPRRTSSGSGRLRQRTRRPNRRPQCGTRHGAEPPRLPPKGAWDYDGQAYGHDASVRTAGVRCETPGARSTATGLRSSSSWRSLRRRCGTSGPASGIPPPCSTARRRRSACAARWPHRRE